ncbi:MAG: hypothetical protein CM15mP75_3270 [Flammeovirgaceae bacterium]|nr:MAG: hypothetical protein CM15mP75_3270 [Flammeovirgaceae bacterium]
MEDMFLDARSFNKNLSSWDVSSFFKHGKYVPRKKASKVIYHHGVKKKVPKKMNGMLYDTVFYQNISNWNVNKVTDMGFMFGPIMNLIKI